MSAKAFLSFYSHFYSKRRSLKHVNTASDNEAVLTSTNNLCFLIKISKNVYTCKLQFMKVGIEGARHETKLT